MPIDDPIFSTTALSYASDASYAVTGDSYDSSPVKVEPTLTQIRQGLLRPGQQIPGQHLTWVLAQFAALMGGLVTNDGLHEERFTTDEGALADAVTRITTLEGYPTTRSPRVKLYRFTSSGTWNPGNRVLAALAYLKPGGGAGGQGQLGSGSTSVHLPGGGGGGEGVGSFFPIFLGGTYQRNAVVGGGTQVVDPSTACSIIVGAGGAPSSVAGGVGGDGGDTMIRQGPLFQAIAGGAQGGNGAGTGGFTNDTTEHFILGGMAHKAGVILPIGNYFGQGIQVDVTPGSLFYQRGLAIPMQPGQGGWGSTGLLTPAGNGMPTTGYGGSGQPGGRGGTKGKDNPANPTQRGGGAGGGGGGNGGGGGGNGTDAVRDGSELVPYGDGTYLFGDATPGIANSGGGGGGGGSGAYNSDYRKAAAAGGSGICIIVTIEETA